MAIPFHKPVSSIEAIQSSIECDSQVCRWFLRYIYHPSVQRRTPNSVELQNHYKTLKKFERYTWALLIILAGVTITVFLTKENLFFVLGIPVLYGIYRCSSMRRKQVAAISCALLEEDRENIQFESKTLFQICEIYGKKLDIPTLVDTITGRDAIMRRTFIFACVTTCFIYPFGFWDNWVIIIGSYFLIQTFVNTPLVFDRLK
jgi:hypothetical protein